MRLKRSLLAVMAAVVLAQPIHSPDGVPLPTNDRGLGREVIACGSCIYRLAFEDFYGPASDRDFNDAEFEIEFGDVPERIVRVTLLQRQSLFSGYLTVPQSVKPNAIVQIGYRVNVIKAPWVVQPDGLIFYTGGGSGNPDGLVHAAVYCLRGCRP